MPPRNPRRVTVSQGLLCVQDDDGTRPIYFSTLRSAENRAQRIQKQYPGAKPLKRGNRWVIIIPLEVA